MSHLPVLPSCRRSGRSNGGVCGSGKRYNGSSSRRLSHYEASQDGHNHPYDTNGFQSFVPRCSCLVKCRSDLSTNCLAHVDRDVEETDRWSVTDSGTVHSERAPFAEEQPLWLHKVRNNGNRKGFNRCLSNAHANPSEQDLPEIVAEALEQNA